MFDKFKKSEFAKKMKNPKVSRAIYITVVMLLVAAAVVIGVISAASRARRNTPPASDTTVSDTTTKAPPHASDTTAPIRPETTVPVPTTTAPTPKDVNVVNKLPDFVLPVNGKLYRKHDPTVQVFSDTMQDYRVHLGIDIATKAGAPVYAAADGKVAKIWKDPMMGYSIALNHSGEAVTVYKNLGETLPEGIAEGVSVRSGQLIATVGESAMIESADEAHLHFEMTVAGLMVNPLDVFDTATAASLNTDTGYED